MLGPFKFPVTLNSFTCFPSYTNFIFSTVSYCSSSSCCCSLAAAGTSSSCCCSLPSSSASFSTMSFLSISSVRISYSPWSCYTIKKQFNVRSTVFRQVHLVFLPWVLIQRRIILKLYFSKWNSSFSNIYFEKIFETFVDRKNDSWWHYAQVTSKWSFIDAESYEKLT